MKKDRKNKTHHKVDHKRTKPVKLNKPEQLHHLLRQLELRLN